jgi:hypothetical protein
MRAVFLFGSSYELVAQSSMRSIELRKEIAKLHKDLAVAANAMGENNKTMIHGMQDELGKQSTELMTSTYELPNAKFSRMTSCTGDSTEPSKQPNDNDMNDPLDPDDDSDCISGPPRSEDDPTPGMMHSLNGAACTTSDMDSFSRPLSCPLGARRTKCAGLHGRFD